MSSSADFSGKVVLITGSSSGIGYGVAVLLSSLGAQVVITGRNEERLNKVAEECREASPQKLKPVAVVADISKESDCRQLVDETIKQCGRLDVLINNAGAGKPSPIGSPDLMDIYDETMTINLRNVIFLTHLCVPHLAETKGNIVSIASVAGHRPIQFSSVYDMAKAGLLMATRVLAIELGPMGIRVNSISPALIKTGMTEIFGDEMNEAIGKSYPVGRYGVPQDVANAIAYLASDDASFVSGADLLFDGGSIDTHEQYTIMAEAMAKMAMGTVDKVEKSKCKISSLLHRGCKK